MKETTVRRMANLAKDNSLAKGPRASLASRPRARAERTQKVNLASRPEGSKAKRPKVSRVRKASRDNRLNQANRAGSKVSKRTNNSRNNSNNPAIRRKSEFRPQNSGCA